jgi:hypothetical protein
VYLQAQPLGDEPINGTAKAAVQVQRGAFGHPLHEQHGWVSYHVRPALPVVKELPNGKQPGRGRGGEVEMINMMIC